MHSGACGDRKRASDSLELRAVVSHTMYVLETELKFSRRAAGILGPFFQPHPLLFIILFLSPG